MISIKNEIESHEIAQKIIEEDKEEDEDEDSANYTPHRIASLAFTPEHHLGHFGDHDIPVMYNIKKSELIFYIMFTLIMVPFTLLSDSFLHMTQELHHGWKVYDFVAYQKYRFIVILLIYFLFCST